ncbi:hypothetical protein SUDANB15_04842 [Streptomyces sp. enrichment culture]|uniref:hypothetical protein n=1 Tax=Streptomyces sp. enrichment culture TaxID=1795815 RepID=UPI003F571C05
MKDAGALAVGATLVVWLLWNAWNLLRIALGLRDGAWRRPMWWTRVCSVSLFVGCASWVRGALSGGLDVGESCAYLHHQHYDQDYRSSHAEELDRLFPLSNKCNADYDLVPAWVNPAVVVCAAVFLVAAAVLVRFGVARLTGSRRSTPRPLPVGKE